MAKLPEGVTVYHGAHKFEGECPDDLMPTAYTQPSAGGATKKQVDASVKSSEVAAQA